MLLFLKGFISTFRCVWCGADLGQLSGHASSFDATLAVRVNGEGGRLAAKRRGGRPELWRKAFISLMSEAR